MRQMSTLWSNSASVLKSNAVTKAWQRSRSRTCDRRGDPHRASAGASAAAECCVSLLSPAVAPEHPDQSSVQRTPGLPGRPRPRPAQTDDCPTRTANALFQVARLLVRSPSASVSVVTFHTGGGNVGAERRRRTESAPSSGR